MIVQRWESVKELLHQAMQLGPERRARFLDEACSSNGALRAEVESLLLAEEGVRSSFLQSKPSLGGPGDDDDPIDAAGALEAGQSSRFQLLRKLGEGGMGQVWLAEQTSPVRRQVALKLIKAGMFDEACGQRFQSERQSLAMMDHPAIAKVFDAGSTPQGAPYFVMEYVSGVSITAYCDNRRLTTRERLELFVRVCEGVQHAHQKAIIHRDLKPSNILVTEVDGRPAPKIIDFGVAKAVTRELTAETTFTRAGTIVGTPEYMSPEQANSSGEDIDTRTDVYSLGVIFYELLAGVPPLDLRAIAFEEFLRRLREEEPSKPSTRIRGQALAASTELARRRQTEPVTLAKQMRGDLDSIALKALEKDRSRRYSSPSDLAGEIGRYLRNEAVLAVAPSFAYRAAKFARRHRGALATACAFALVLIVAAGVSIRQSVRANREAAAAQAVNDFLQNDLLAQASVANQLGPSAKPDPHLEVRTVLDRAAARIAGKFRQQPEVEAAVRDTIGQTYMDLGLYPEARTQLERALYLDRRVLGAENPKTLKTTSRLGRTATFQGKYAEAEVLFGQALEIQRRVLGVDRPDTLYSMNSLAAVYYYQGKYAQAEALLSRTLEIRRQMLGSEHPDTLTSMSSLAGVYSVQGKYAQAEALYSQTLEMLRRVLGPEYPETLRCMNNLAIVYRWEGRYLQAEVLLRQSLEARRRVLGPEHPETLLSLGTLASIYDDQGKYSQAEILASRILDIQRRVLGNEHPDTLTAMNNLAHVYVAQGRYKEAEALRAQTLEIRRRVLGPKHFNTLVSMNSLAYVYAVQGKYAQAEVLFRQALEVGRRELGPEHPLILNALEDFAFLYQLQGKYALAETYAAQALAGWRHASIVEETDTMDAATGLALSYLSQRKFAQSEPLAREAMENYRKKKPDDWARFRAESLLGASLAGHKKYADAEPLLVEGYEGMLARKDRIAVPDRYHLDRAREWLVQLYQAWGRPEKAAQWRRKSDPGRVDRFCSDAKVRGSVQPSQQEIRRRWDGHGRCVLSGAEI
jgi:eukaryotic-like serine/threonine-protein kinase